MQGSNHPLNNRTGEYPNFNGLAESFFGMTRPCLPKCSSWWIRNTLQLETIGLSRLVSGDASLKVLLPIEGSPFSAIAVQSVVNRSWKADTEFLVVCLHEPAIYKFAVPPTSACMKELEKVKGELYERLNEIASSAAKHISEQAGCSASSRFVEIEKGEVVESLVGIAKDWQANLIVVGSPILAAKLAEQAGPHCDVETFDTRMTGEAELTSE